MTTKNTTSESAREILDRIMKEGEKILSVLPESHTVIRRTSLDELFEDKKRSTAILQPIGLDMALAAIIKKTFPQRNAEVQKLMNSINMIQKARLAYILRLIDKTVLDDLEQIHEIRNKFGHSLDASFAYSKVLNFVRRLSTATGQEVTEKNSYKFHQSAVAKCLAHLVTASQRRQAQQG